MADPIMAWVRSPSITEWKEGKLGQVSPMNYISGLRESYLIKLVTHGLQLIWCDNRMGALHNPNLFQIPFCVWVPTSTQFNLH